MIKHIERTGMERRNLLRKRTAFAGTIDLSTPSVSESVAAEVLDVSSGGVCVRIGRDLTPGVLVKLSLGFEDTGIKVPCIAEVKWVDRDSISCRAGLQFLV